MADELHVVEWESPEGTKRQAVRLPMCPKCGGKAGTMVVHWNGPFDPPRWEVFCCKILVAGPTFEETSARFTGA